MLFYFIVSLFATKYLFWLIIAFTNINNKPKINKKNIFIIYLLLKIYKYQ